MALPVTGPVTTTKSGVRFVLRPPLEFIQRQVGEFRRELEDLDPLWDRFSEVLPDIFGRWFASHGDGEWPPLAESTIEQKSRLGYPPDPLVRTGHLLDTLRDPNAAVERSPDQMSWGSEAEYAGYHQEGDGVPQRQVIPDPFPAEDRRKLEQEMVEWLNEAMADTLGRVRAA